MARDKAQRRVKREVRAIPRRVLAGAQRKTFVGADPRVRPKNPLSSALCHPESAAADDEGSTLCLYGLAAPQLGGCGLVAP